MRSSVRQRPLLFVKKTGSSSHELSSATEYVTGPNPLQFRRKATTSHGVWFLIATKELWIHLTTNPPGLAYGPLSTFLTSSAVYTPENLAGLFHPATCRIHLTRVFPTAKPAHLIGGPYPHDVLRTFPVAERTQQHQSRTRAFRVLIRAVIRYCRQSS
jgi:hypothetical protein